MAKIVDGLEGRLHNPPCIPNLMKLSFVLFACLPLFLVGCVPAVRLHDPAGVMRAEIEAIDGGQLDLATSYFSDDAQIVTGFGQPQGKDKIKAFITYADPTEWLRINLKGQKEGEVSIGR